MNTRYPPQDPKADLRMCDDDGEAAEIREALARVERGQVVDLGSFAQYADDGEDEYRQSTTACCPRETIPDSCSCPDGCECSCADCDCPADEGSSGDERG